MKKVSYSIFIFFLTTFVITGNGVASAYSTSELLPWIQFKFTNNLPFRMCVTEDLPLKKIKMSARCISTGETDIISVQQAYDYNRQPVIKFSNGIRKYDFKFIVPPHQQPNFQAWDYNGAFSYTPDKLHIFFCTTQYMNNYHQCYK